ncbi:hypothetical protein ACET3Z_001706 [Daucus carota]
MLKFREAPHVDTWAEIVTRICDKKDEVLIVEDEESVNEDFGSIDILVYSLANEPEVTKPLLGTSRKGYLAAVSASSFSYVSLLKNFIPITNPGTTSVL